MLATVPWTCPTLISYSIVSCSKSGMCNAYGPCKSCTAVGKAFCSPATILSGTLKHIMIFQLVEEEDKKPISDHS